MPDNRLLDIIASHEAEIAGEWTNEQSSFASRYGTITAEEIRSQCIEFVRLLKLALQADSEPDAEAPAFDQVREQLASLSRSRTLQGFTASEIAKFIFSLKPVLARLANADLAQDPAELASVILLVHRLLDSLGLFTFEIYQKTREDVIARQGQELLELSTPVVKLWDGVLALPLIGTLDSARTQVVMESLLQKIVETGADVAIIDITGVPTVDTLVAQHLLKTVTAARLMGADCIISGIRPQIAQTIVHLGVELGDITTKASLADAFKIALTRAGLTVVRAKAAAKD